MLASAAVLALALSACGTDRGEVALVIASARQASPTEVEVVSDECADQLRTQVERDAGGSDLPQITLWGRPRPGRCEPRRRARLPAPTTERGIVDGATGTVLPVDR